MKQFLLVALLSVAAMSIYACGEDDQWSKLKDRCLDYNKTLEHCFVDPADYQRSVSACDAFNKASTGAEYKDFFLCKEECVDNAVPAEVCDCLLAPEHGGPDC